jgi:hypothetical protein
MDQGQEVAVMVKQRREWMERISGRNAERWVRAGPTEHLPPWCIWAASAAVLIGLLAMGLLAGWGFTAVVVLIALALLVAIILYV